MTRRYGALAGAVCMLACTSCNWSGSDDDFTWNDAYSWVNFSGTYRLYTPVTLPDETATETEVQVTNEDLGRTTATDTFSGTLRNRPVVAGSVTIKVGGTTFTDNGAEVLVGGNGGTIKYGTGAWTARTTGTADPGQPIRATYRYRVAAATPSSGQTLSTITVNQTGNILTMTDNHGTVYNGKVTGASVPANAVNAANNVRFTFEVKSAQAKIVGTLSGDWSGVGENATSGTLSNRQLQGTYISGRTEIDIRAVSGSVSITPRPITSE